MEEEPGVEPRNPDPVDQEMEGAEEEWKGWQAGQLRNILHLVSAAAQWILLLLCLIYLGVNSLRASPPRSDKVPWTHIRYTGKSTKGVAVNLTAEVGSVQIRNGSILITCDGLYLVSLKCNNIIFSDLEEEGLLNLTLCKADNKNCRALWEQTVQKSDKAINLTTVLYLFDQDNLTLWTSFNAIIEDLSFSLVLLSPLVHCRR